MRTYPPPYRPEDDLYTQDLITDAYNSQFKGYEATPEGELLKKYFRYIGTPSRDVIESYNNIMLQQLQHQIVARPLYTKSIIDGQEMDVKVVMENLIYCKPTYTQGTTTSPLYPENARRLHIPYLATAAARPVMYVHIDDPNSNHPSGKSWARYNLELPHQEIFKIPAMLGSSLCHLEGITDPEQLAALGMDSDDPLGYFIVENGRSRVILNIQKLRLNNIFVLPAMNKVSSHCRLTVLTPTGTKQMQIVIGQISGNKYGDLLLQLGSFKKKGEVGSSSKAVEGVNILHIVRILNDITGAITLIGNQDISDYFRARLKMFVKPENWNRVLNKFRATEVMYSNVSPDVARSNVINFLRVNVPPESPNIERERILKLHDMFADYLFPNIDRNDIVRKIDMLAIMSARLLEYEVGLADPDDRDSWSKNKLSTSAESVSQLIRLEWVRVIMSVQKDLEGTSVGRKATSKTASKAKTVYTLQEVANKLKGYVDSMNDKIVAAFGGTNWGKNGNFARNNLSDILEDNNITEIVSHITSIDVNAERRTKSLDIRGVKATQAGGVCLDGATDDTSCGLKKNKAITGYTTAEEDPNPVIALILSSVHFSLEKTETKPDYILVGSVIIGWCDAATMYKYLVMMRRKGVIYKHAEFVNARKGYLEVYTCGGRLVRPLCVVDENGLLALDNNNARDKDLKYLLDHGYVEMIGLAEQERLVIAYDPEVLNRRLSKIKSLTSEYEELVSQIVENPVNMSDMENNEDLKLRIKSIRSTLSMEEYPYDYCEIHPIALVGASASNVPFLNTNPSTRISYQSKMEKQSMQPRGVNPHHHDGTEYVKNMASQPIIRTATAEGVGIDLRPTGSNVILCIGAFSGFNQEDALVFNKKTLESGIFDYTRYITKSVSLTTTSTMSQAFGLPWFDQSSASRYHAIGNDGLPIKGTFIRPNDCIVGKYQYIQGRDPGNNRDRFKEETRNVSEYMKVGEYGIVESVKKIPHKNGSMFVSVKLRLTCRPAVGDKFFVSPSQKATVALIENPENLPFDPETGLIPDVFMNPHAIPSRMTMGVLFEMMYGTALVKKGMTYDATGHQKFDTVKFREMIAQFETMGKGNAMRTPGRPKITWAPGESPIEKHRKKVQELEKYYYIADIVPAVSIPEYVDKNVSSVLLSSLRAYLDDPTNSVYWYIGGLKSVPLQDTPVDDTLRSIVRKSMLTNTIPYPLKLQIMEQVKMRDELVAFINKTVDVDIDYYHAKLDVYMGLYGHNSEYAQSRYIRLTQLLALNPDNETVALALENCKRYVSPEAINVGERVDSLDDIPNTMTMAMQDMINKILIERDNLADEVRNFEKVFMSGDVIMKSGTTGITYPGRVSIGPVRMYNTVHIAANKIQARGKGKRDPVTRQPNRGRSSHGAVKFGDMDLRAVQSHGASAIAQERMCTLSDAYEMPMCIDCGVVATYIPHTKSFSCPLNSQCSKFGRITVAYVYKYLMQILGPTGILIRTKVATEDTYPEKMLQIRNAKKREYIDEDEYDDDDEMKALDGIPEDEGEVAPELSDDEDYDYYEADY